MDEKAEKMKCKNYVMKHMPMNFKKIHKNFKGCCIGGIWSSKFLLVSAFWVLSVSLPFLSFKWQTVQKWSTESLLINLTLKLKIIASGSFSLSNCLCFGWTHLCPSQKMQHSWAFIHHDRHILEEGDLHEYLPALHLFLLDIYNSADIHLFLQFSFLFYIVLLALFVFFFRTLLW